METALRLKLRFGRSVSDTLSTPISSRNEKIVLEARNLTVRRGRHLVLRQVDLQVSAGETIALFGANGAGKTTLLLCLAGLVRPTHGSVQWFSDQHAAKSDARSSIGFLGHERGLYGALTVRENLCFAAHMLGVKKVSELVDKTLAEANLDADADSLARHLSRGMGQRLALARALFHDPVLALLDEPFASLDAPGENWLQDCLRRRQQRNLTTIFSSHDHAHSQTVADRSLLLRDGALKIVQDDSEDFGGPG